MLSATTIEIGHVAPEVGAHDRVADGVERDLCALLFFEQRLGVRRALDHAADSLRQQVIVEAGLEQIILRSTLYRQLRHPRFARSREPGMGIAGAARKS